MAVAHFVGNWYTGFAAHLDPGTGGGESMDILLTFFLSVAAGIVSYYICKWIDRHKKGS